MDDPTKMTKFDGRTIMRDETLMAEIEVRLQSIDKYHFFFRVPIEDITPFIQAGAIGNMPSAWSFPGPEGKPKRVIGSSCDEEYFYFYVESEDQTLTRITKF